MILVDTVFPNVPGEESGLPDWHPNADYLRSWRCGETVFLVRSSCVCLCVLRGVVLSRLLVRTLQ
jgi:hypothetical protein